MALNLSNNSNDTVQSENYEKENSKNISKNKLVGSVVVQGK